MALLVIVVTGGPAHVLIFTMRWLVVATIISSRGLGRMNPSCLGRALRPRAAGAAITIIPIVPTFLMVPMRSFQGLSLLGIMKWHGLCFLETERKGAPVFDVILDRF